MRLLERVRHWLRRNRVPPPMDGWCVATPAGPIPWTFSLTRDFAETFIDPRDRPEQRVVPCRLTVLQHEPEQASRLSRS